jgi:enoyl-CoA hydratase/carnithine racemase
LGTLFNRCFKHERVEDVVAALEADGSKFAMDTVDTIMKRSPTSVKVTHEHLRIGSKLSFQECLKMEHRLWQTVPVSLCVSDFFFSNRLILPF